MHAMGQVIRWVVMTSPGMGGELYRVVGVQFAVNARTPSAQLNAEGFDLELPLVLPTSTRLAPHTR